MKQLAITFFSQKIVSPSLATFTSTWIRIESGAIVAHQALAFWQCKNTTHISLPPINYYYCTATTVQWNAQPSKVSASQNIIQSCFESSTFLVLAWSRGMILFSESILSTTKAEWSLMWSKLRVPVYRAINDLWCGK